MHNVTYQLIQDDDSEEDEKFSELTTDFEYELAKCYFKSLQEEYDYRLSDEAIIESIESNDYEFTEDGERF